MFGFIFILKIKIHQFQCIGDLRPALGTYNLLEICRPEDTYISRKKEDLDISLAPVESHKFWVSKLFCNLIACFYSYYLFTAQYASVSILVHARKLKDALSPQEKINL